MSIWNSNTISNIGNYTNFGCDLESYLTDILSEELSKEINKQIMETLFGEQLKQEEARRKLRELRELRNKKIQDIFGDDLMY